MDLHLSPSERTFRDRACAWLDSVGRPTGLRDYGATATLDDIDAARLRQARLYEAGFAGLSWPTEFGGVEATTIERGIWAEETARIGGPPQINLVGCELVGPMIIELGTSSQQRRFLDPILRGDHVWCQLFSEPDAGSDLANLRTLARKDANGWRVTGQKVWTSGAHYVGVDDVLGEVNDGWRVAVSTLGRERLMIGANAVRFSQHLDELWEIAGSRTADPLVRDAWCDLYTRTHLLRMHWFRLLAAIEDNRDPRTSMLKLTATKLERDLSRFAGEVLGDYLLAGTSHKVWRQRYLSAPGQTIAGGTSEIQRNIVARRVLPLPAHS